MAATPKKKTVKKSKTAADIQVIVEENESPTGKITLISPLDISVSPKLQMRKNPIDRVYVDYLLEVLVDSGDRWPFPPVRCLTRENTDEYDNPSYYLFDGFHRLTAAKEIGFDPVPVELFEIDCENDKALFEEARWRACYADLDTETPQPLGRTIADKRKAAIVAVSLNEKRNKAEKLSDREIARRLKVSHTFISNLRKPSQIETPEETTLTGRERMLLKPPVVKFSFAFDEDQNCDPQRMAESAVNNLFECFYSKVGPYDPDMQDPLKFLKLFRSEFNKAMDDKEEIYSEWDDEEDEEKDS